MVVSRVEDVVESLEERHAIDEVESFAAVGPQVADDEVHELASAPDRSVELSKELSRCRSDDTSSCQKMSTYSARPSLCVWNELKSVLIHGCELGVPDKRTISTDIADLEEQALEVGKLSGREPQQTGVVVQNGTREALVSGEGVWEAGHMSLREPSRCPNALTASKE